MITIDGRETAPASFTATVFADASGQPLDLAAAVSSGLSVGVPGTPVLWDLAARRYGTRSLSTLLAPAEQLARRGFVVDATYTLTIEQIGGSGITVPGYGFLLNNELTDFNFVPVTPGVPDPNLPGPGKRPRSSMSPTIVTRGGRPYLALGTPGGATIITTVVQVLTGQVDRGLSLVDAVAAPRLSSRNGRAEDAEPPIANGPSGRALARLGHVLTATAEIGAATAVEFRSGGHVIAVAEPARRGGGAAGVVRPDSR